MSEGKLYRTKSGAMLTADDLRRIATEAEQGYCVERVTTDEAIARCFRPMPCPIHGES